jgi:hydroxyquinol 1,2-dioxygenase
MGKPIEGAKLDVWSDNADGYYDVQQPDIQPKFNNRGIFTTGADGRYSFRGIRPVSYPIPDDGPVGRCWRRLAGTPTDRRICTSSSPRPVMKRIITHTFVDGDEWLTSDAVFGVKASLISTMEPGDEGDTMWKSSFDFIMVEQD